MNKIVMFFAMFAGSGAMIGLGIDLGTATLVVIGMACLVGTHLLVMYTLLDNI